MTKRIKAFELKKGKNVAPYYKVDPKIRDVVPYDKVYDDGVFVYDKNCSVIFKYSIDEKDELMLLQTLRKADAVFRLYKIEKQEYFILYEEKEYEEFLLYAAKIVDLVNSFCSIQQLNLNERFRLLHNNCRIGNAEKGDLQFGEYLTNYHEWKETFQLGQYNFFPREMVPEIESKDTKMILLSIGSLPKDIIRSRELMGMLKRETETNSGIFMRIFEPIEDQIVFKSIKNRFMGLEANLVKIRNEQPDFYKVFTNPTSDDKQLYVFAGALLLIVLDKNQDKEEMEKRIGEIKYISRQLGGKLFPLIADKENIFKNLIGLRCDPGYTRIEKTKDIEKMIPAKELLMSEEKELIQKYML